MYYVSDLFRAPRNGSEHLPLLMNARSDSIPEKLSLLYPYCIIVYIICTPAYDELSALCGTNYYLITVTPIFN